MAIIPIEQVPSQGIQNAGPANLDVPFGSFRALVNCRLVPGKGRIEQTPAWYTTKSWTAGTYYVGGSQTEDATSTPSLLYISGDPTTGFTYIAASDQTFRVDGVQKKVIKQITAPAASAVITSQKGCLATFGDYSTLNLGSTLDVVIDGATTFKWRVNGGAYTTTVPIAASVTLGAQIVIYFLAVGGAFTGYTVNDTWSWQRTDAPSINGGYINPVNWPYTVYRNTVSIPFQCYFIAGDSQVMYYDGVGVRSVGYRPIYALSLEIYEGHLVVGSYATSYGTSYNSVIAWSDLNDFDNFIATDTNEADTFTIPALRSNANVTSGSTTVQLSVTNGILFADCTNQRWATSYLGLPAVFSFKRFCPLEFTNGYPFLVKTKTRTYFTQTDGIYYFNGAENVRISQKLDGFFNTNTSTTYPVSLYESFFGGLVNPVTQEVWFFSTLDLTRTYQAFYIYSEVTEEWYIRSASFTKTGTALVLKPLAMAFGSGIAVLSKPLGLIAEDVLGTQTTLVKDSAQGTVFQTPTIELQDLSVPSVQKVKEIESLYLDAYYPMQPSSAYTCTGVKIEVSGRTYADAPVTYVTSPTPPTWVKTTTNAGVISLRVPGARIFRFRITALSGNTAKYPFGFTYNRLIVNTYGTDAKEVRK